MIAGCRLRIRRAGAAGCVPHALQAAACIVICAVVTCAQTGTPQPVEPDPQQLYEEVKRAIADKRFAEAHSLVTRVTAADPSFAEAHRAAAHVNFELGRHSEAEESVRRFRQLVPRERSDMLILLGRIQIALAKYSEAVASFERVRILKPGAPGIYTSLGKLYYRLKHFPLAIERLESALRQEPSRFREEATKLLISSHMRQVEILAQKDRFPEAVVHLGRVLELDSSLAVAFLKRGAMLAELGWDLSQAEQDVIAYIAREAGTTRAHLLLGRIRQQRGELRGAIESYEKALELEPEIPGVNAVLGALYGLARNAGKSIEHFRKAVELNPEKTISRYNLGITYYRIEDFEKAGQTMRAVIAMRPDMAGPYLVLAQVDLQSGRIESSLAHLERWAARVKRRQELSRLEKERVFEMLYNHSQYRTMVRDLRNRFREEQQEAGHPPAGAENGTAVETEPAESE